jgi:hypothetical protein
MKLRVLTACVPALVLAAGPLCAADARPAVVDKARELVRRLGSEDFADRDAAAEELDRLGRDAEPALREGASSDDAEVRRRCADLLARATRTDLQVALDAFLADRADKHLVKLPAWATFHKLVADQPAGRALFVEMCTSEPDLLAALDRDPASVPAKFGARVQEIQKTLYGVNRVPVTLGTAVALLYVAADERVGGQLSDPATVNSLYTMTGFLYQPEPRQGLQDNPAARKVLASFLERRGNDPNFIYQVIGLAQNHNLKECVPWAVGLAKNKAHPAQARGQALTLVGRLGEARHIADVEPLLEDTTALGQVQFQGGRIETQMRDVALATMVQLSGQQLLDYDFPYVKQVQNVIIQNPNFQYPANWLGFGSDEARQAALKKWKASAPARK